MSEATKPQLKTALDKTNETDSEKVGKPDRSSTALLIPWSVREGFTNDVCGLPGAQQGCWRFRETGKLGFDNNARGISPGAFKDNESLVAWIVFESTVGREGEISVTVQEHRPPSSDSCHQAIFGFTKDGLEAFAIQANSTDSADYPNYIKFVGIVGNRKVEIKNWVRDRSDATDELGLADCFGQNTFVSQIIKSDILGPKALNLSLSDLIRSYLNHNKECRFRRSDSSRGVGITMCKVGVTLNKNRVESRNHESPTDEPRDLLSLSAISFSYVDNVTSRIKKLPQWNIEKRSAGAGDARGDYLRALHADYFVPLRVRRFAEQAQKSQDSAHHVVNFASSLSKYGRQSVLPTEVGKSFLSFSTGEITSYLAHWLLLRIFASDDPVNRAFVETFAEWRMQVRSNNASHSQAFSKLLNLRVMPSVDTNTFTEKILDGWQKERFGVYGKPVTFSEALSILGLSRGACSARILPTLAFLKQFFDPSESFQQLPMYKGLNWRESSLLNSLTQSSTKENRVEAILACLAEAAGLTFDEKRTSVALTELRDHCRRCVFPIADVLANMPYCDKVSLHYYYVFPLWEDTISDDAGNEWRGPVIFAHVVTRALQMEQQNSLPSNEKVVALGERLQDVLIPAGAAIAHGYYNEERKITGDLRLAQVTAWTQARAWAHEVKNYTAPIITDLGRPALRDIATVPEEVRIVIGRARRAMLILNAASKAIQLAISKLAITSKSSDEKIEALPREYAQDIVEAVLQYLLNYRVETRSQRFLIEWTPKYTTDQAIERLCSVLVAIRRKLDLQDIERTVLGDKVVIGVIALLREVIGNIRMDVPYDSPGVINISYDFSNDEDWLTLDLGQDQVEKAKGEELPDEPPGVKMANELLGDNGAKFGSIKFLRSESNPKPGGKGFEVSYRVQVKFALSQRSNQH